MDFIDDNVSFPLFEKVPDVNKEGSQWTSCEIGDAINLLYQNLHKLDSFISNLVRSHFRAPIITNLISQPEKFCSQEEYFQFDFQDLWPRILRSKGICSYYNS